jgi:hypothetical protein
MFQQTGDYDEVFFRYFDQTNLSPTAILSAIGKDRRASRSYTQHLVAVGNLDAAQQGWEALLRGGLLDDELTALYISDLLRNHRFEIARRDWLDANAAVSRANENLLFNGGFERDLTKCPLDWGIVSSEQFKTTRDNSVAHDGRWSLKIEFEGNGNVFYANLAQTVVLNPGRYHFGGWIKTSRLTTDQGLTIEILDSENPANVLVRTPMFTGTHDWISINQSFSVPKSSHAVLVRAVRSPSMKFDNAITGTVWLDSFTIRSSATA